jgi:hypothetical protein
MKRGVVLWVAAIATIAACESRGTLFGPSAIGLSVTVVPKLDTIFVTDTIGVEDVLQLNARVRSAATGGFVTVPIEWSSSDPAVATVDELGLVQARGFGVTTITADVNGKSGTARVEVVRRTR